MDVRLSAEQEALRDSAARLVGTLGPRTVPDLDDVERVAKLDAAVASAGWRELRSADVDGTPWASGVEVCVIAEQLGRSLADTAFVGPILAAELRRLAGAATAPSAETVLLSPDLSTLATTDDGALPAGAVAVDAAGAERALVLETTGPGWSLAAVEVPEAVSQVDLTRSVAPVGSNAAFHQIDGQTRTVGPDGVGRVTALGLAITSADLVGTMGGAVRLATDYAAERRQYGRPVGAFQAVQHLLADAHVATEGSRSLAQHASWAVDALPPHDAAIAGSVAKAYAARAARDVCETAIQVHAGIGNTWECLAHVHLRRALLSGDMFGGVDANLARVLDDALGVG